MNITNASQYPRVYYCRHMQPGTALYADEGMWLVDNQGMKNLIGSVGKEALPIYIGHQNVDLKNIKEQASGYVVDSFYNKNDGWAWFKFVIVDDAGHDAIKKGWAVSNAYVMTERGGPGTKNNVPYKGEVLNGKFTHLAIVPDPRYEGACIMTPDEFKNYQEKMETELLKLQNSRNTTQEKKPMFKFFNKVETDAPTDDSMVEIDGEMKNWGEIKNALEKKEKEASQIVVINGKKMTQAEAIDAYKELVNGKKKMKNTDEADEEGEEGKKSKEEEAAKTSKNPKSKENKKKEKKNEDDGYEEDCRNAEEDEDEAEEEEKKETKEKKNSKVTVITVEKSDEFFNAMKNAINKKQAEPQALVDTSMDQIQRGKQRYGSTPAKKA